jgi:hypothetical protein
VSRGNPRSWRSLGAVAVLALFYASSYRDATGAFFHYDDFWVLAESAAVEITRPSDVLKFFVPGRNGFVLYRPLSTVVYFRSLRAAFGYDPGGYHAVQLTFHFLNGVLVYAICRAISATRLLALMAALLYAAAPGHAIAVYWMALFTMTGTAFLYLLGLWLWLRPNGRGRVPLCLICFIGGLLAGEHAITFPLVLTAATVFLEGRWPNRSDWGRQAPFYAVAVCYLAAKGYYFRYLLPSAFPDPVTQAIVWGSYGLDFDPWRITRELGGYLAHASSPLFPLMASSEAWLSAAKPVLGAFAFLGLIALAVAARPGVCVSDSTRAAAFGSALFLISLTPVLLLSNHFYGYYVGIAGAGLSVALVAAASFGRTGLAALGAWLAITVALHATLTWQAVRREPQFDLFRNFSHTAGRWFYTIERVAQRNPDVTELLVTRNPLTSMLFDDTGAHRLLLPEVGLVVRTVEDIAQVAPRRGTLVMTAPYVLPPNRPWPGSRPQWDWLRSAPLS